MSKKNREMVYNTLVKDGRLDAISDALKAEFGEPKPAPEPKKGKK